MRLVLPCPLAIVPISHTEIYSHSQLPPSAMVPLNGTSLFLQILRVAPWEYLAPCVLCAISGGQDLPVADHSDAHLH